MTFSFFKLSANIHAGKDKLYIFHNIQQLLFYFFFANSNIFIGVVLVSVAMFLSILNNMPCILFLAQHDIKNDYLQVSVG